MRIQKEFLVCTLPKGKVEYGLKHMLAGETLGRKTTEQKIKDGERALHS